LWELRQRRVQLIRVQVKEEIEPKEAAVKREGRVSFNVANLKARRMY